MTPDHNHSQTLSMIEMTAGSSSHAAIADPSAVRNMRSPRENASDRVAAHCFATLHVVLQAARNPPRTAEKVQGGHSLPARRRLRHARNPNHLRSELHRE